MGYIDHGFLSRKFLSIWVYVIWLNWAFLTHMITDQRLFFGGVTGAIFLITYLLHRTELAGIKLKVGSLDIETPDKTKKSEGGQV